MNTGYLDGLPKVENNSRLVLEDGEKVVFAAKLYVYGDETGSVLGRESAFTLTNKRIAADNGLGIWTVDIAEDIVNCTKVAGGKLIFKYTYFLVKLNREIVYADGSHRLNGFQFYFSKEDASKFEQIANILFQ